MMIVGIERVLIDEKPDMIMIQGDTNAVLAGALVASKLHIPVGHVEAGLRSYDKTMPEEINRVVADVCSKLYFAPTEDSAINLLFEGINPHDVFITGNTIVDACMRNLEIAKRRSKISSKLDLAGDILAVTVHRAENVDNKERLRGITDALAELDDLNIIFPVHPRTDKNLKKFGFYKKLDEASHIKMIKPLGYLDFLLLLSYSKLVMTDSGGVQEEAITLGIPCMTLRYNTERPETIKAGGNILVGTKKDRIIDVAEKILNDQSTYDKMKAAPNPYGDGLASKRIVNKTLQRYHEGKLKIKIPEDTKNYPQRTFIKIRESINVSELEKNKNKTVRVVYEGGVARFPYPDLNLKDKLVLVDKF